MYKYGSGMDMSAFEAHCGPEALLFIWGIEDSKCDMAYVNNFRKCDKGNVLNVLKFKQYGRTWMAQNMDRSLMSGDFDTAFTGTLLSIIMILRVMEACGYSFEIQNHDGLVNIVSNDFAFYDNGDDILVFTNELLDKDLIRNEYRRFGFKSRFECMADNLFDIEFCRSRPVLLNNGELMMLRDSERIVMNTLSSKHSVSDIVNYSYLFCKSFGAVHQYKNAAIGEFFKFVCNGLYFKLLDIFEGNDFKCKSKLIKQMKQYLRSWHINEKFKDAEILGNVFDLLKMFNGFDVDYYVDDTEHPKALECILHCVIDD
jgi:hypothetical protein